MYLMSQYHRRIKPNHHLGHCRRSPAARRPPPSGPTRSACGATRTPSRPTRGTRRSSSWTGHMAWPRPSRVCWARRAQRTGQPPRPSTRPSTTRSSRSCTRPAARSARTSTPSCAATGWRSRWARRAPSILAVPRSSCDLATCCSPSLARCVTPSSPRNPPPRATCVVARRGAPLRPRPLQPAAARPCVVAAAAPDRRGQASAAHREASGLMARGKMIL
jgi:hypothetical protein